ncbi:uncharacterized protein LOC132718180 [Ruditapes philippinarum]|uniref:uncharacterized protein LOC132718180 n=1 Tax=Ruditapes philippinarum TaxID=129788 RepID=UPI00295B410F|nr:uncharacterized protein LOC132718180 [Ruditapes philippinarum]
MFPYIAHELIDIYRIQFETTETKLEKTVALLNDIVQNLETRFELKVPVEQMKNQSKAVYGHLHYLQQLCKDDERLLKEWQSGFKDNVPLSQEETKQREEVVDADIKGDKIQFSETHLTGDKKIIYDDLGTSKMLAQDKIKPSEIHLRHTKDMALKECDEKTQQALTEMFRPGPALLVESTDLKFYKQTIKSYYHILVSDPLFERDTNIVEDIKAFLSELTSHRETKLIENLKLQGKIEQSSRVSLKQPNEDELRRSMSLTQNKGKDRKKGGLIKVDDKQVSTASLQVRGRRVTLWCLQRIQVNLECMTVQIKRIRMSLSRLNTGLCHIDSANIRKSLDLLSLTEEWSQVKKVAQYCRHSKDSLIRKQRLYEHLDWTDYDREESLRSILNELGTNLRSIQFYKKGYEGNKTIKVTQTEPHYNPPKKGKLVLHSSMKQSQFD